LASVLSNKLEVGRIAPPRRWLCRAIAKRLLYSKLPMPGFSQAGKNLQMPSISGIFPEVCKAADHEPREIPRGKLPVAKKAAGLRAKSISSAKMPVC
jgi:hypothetical protein